ncbi:MAG: acylphosphatase [Candidatus Wallbacteria bacterium]|nr:acylphosphatase [Candidatus Wallbacteria bacterium]
MPIITRKIIVSGSVQGVGYRAFVRRKALGSGIKGYVTNCEDGTVEVIYQGELGLFQEFISLLLTGPSMSSVEDLNVAEIEGPEIYWDFTVK